MPLLCISDFVGYRSTLFCIFRTLHTIIFRLCQVRKLTILLHLFSTHFVCSNIYSTLSFVAIMDNIASLASPISEHVDYKYLSIFFHLSTSQYFLSTESGKYRFTFSGTSLTRVQYTGRDKNH